jgi:hypothetical protein
LSRTGSRTDIGDRPKLPETPKNGMGETPNIALREEFVSNAISK